MKWEYKFEIVGIVIAMILLGVGFPFGLIKGNISATAAFIIGIALLILVIAEVLYR